MKIIFALAMLSISTAAQAYDCSDLRAIIKQHGEKHAVKMARDSGVPAYMIKIALQYCKAK